MANNNSNLKPIDVREWYDFIGLMADCLQIIHSGGKEATGFLIQGCNINASHRVLDFGYIGKVITVMGPNEGRQVVLEGYTPNLSACLKPNSESIKKHVEEVFQGD